MLICLIRYHFLVLIVPYDTNLLNGFHFWEKLGEILFKGVLLDGFYGISLGQVTFGNGNLNVCFYRYFPVILSEVAFISCGVPWAIILPPSSPPPGPISMM